MPASDRTVIAPQPDMHSASLQPVESHPCIGMGASLLGGTFACGIVRNHLPEVRRTGMHEGLAVSWLLCGSGTLDTQGRALRLRPGCTCLRRPDRAYAMALDARVLHVRCFLKLPEEAYPLLCRLVPGLDTVPAVRPLPYRDSLVRRIAAFAEAMRRVDDLTAYRLLPEAVELLRALALPPAVLGEDALARAALLLQDPTRYGLSLAEIAETAGLSYHALRKRFAARYGCPPGQYRLARRMELACQALASGDPIADVAERLCFADVYAFTKQFRALTGHTPGAYRRMHIV